MKDYILRHKNIDVANLKLDSVSYSIQKITLLNGEHFPIGVKAEPPILYEWWRSRNMPASREGVKRFLRENKISGISELALKSYGLNLTDQYWIVPKDQSRLKWEDVNFFDNEFKSMEAMLLELNDKSPDISTSGQLPKRWIIEDGTRYLIKNARGPVFSEAYNEKIGSIVCKHLGITHVDYEVAAEPEGAVSSKCECFIDKTTEMITANEIMEIRPGLSDDRKYEHCVICFHEYGITDAKRKLDEMIVLDYIIANADRHAWNFGVIRNADSLKPVSFAPIYDCGNSLWHSSADELIGEDNIGARNPFCISHSEQIKKVSDFSWVEPDRFKDMVEEVEAVLYSNNYCWPERTDRIFEAFKKRVTDIERFSVTTPTL